MEKVNGFGPTSLQPDLKIAAMREIDSGKTVTQVARQLQLNPKLLETWRADWRARGDMAFPGNAANDGDRLLRKSMAHFRDRHPPAVVSGAAASTRQSGNPPKKKGWR
jgi:transposase-like protein